MKEMYLNYKKNFSKKNKIVLLILIIFLIGLFFGSFYITILDNSEKAMILKKVNSFFLSNKKISFENKLILFKNSFISNLIYLLSMWFLGLSVVGIPIILIMLFFKGFVTGFSIGSIFACYKMKGILGILLYIFPNTILLCLFTIFLSIFSLNIAFNILEHATHKKSLNFGTFMGKYFFLLMIIILLSVLCAIFDGFINPHILGLFTNFIK